MMWAAPQLQPTVLYGIPFGNPSEISSLEGEKIYIEGASVGLVV